VQRGNTVGACRGFRRAASEDGDAPDNEGRSNAVSFDREGLLRRMGNDRAAIAAVLNDAVPSVSRKLANLEQAIAHGDTDQARRAAHALKGVAFNLGFNRLGIHAREIERAAESNPEDLPLMFSELRAHWTYLQRILREDA